MEPEPEPKDVIVLEAINKGTKKFDKIERVTKIEGKELNEILENIDKKGLITKPGNLRCYIYPADDPYP